MSPSRLSPYSFGAFAWLLSATMSASGVTAQTRPKAFEPSIAVSHTGSTFLAMSVTGSNFAAPGGGSFLLLNGTVGGQSTSFTIPSTDPSIVAWRDEQVVVLAQPNLAGARMKVRTPAGDSAWSRSDYYAFDWFDTAQVLSNTVGPGHLAIDNAGRVWINGEFHFGVAFFDPVSETVKPAYWPRVPVPAFMTCVFSCVPTTRSGGGEDAAVDSNGRIWLPEGGGAPIAPRNHSRIIGYDPANNKVLIYNLPGDQNGLVGVAWDEARNRLWCTQNQAGNHPAMLTSFNPDHPSIPREEFSWDFSTLPTCNAGLCSDNPSRTCSTFRDCMLGNFDFTTTATCTGGTCSNAPHQPCATVEDCVLAEHICAPGANDSGCFRNYPVGGTVPGHVAVSPFDGTVWFANYDFAGSTVSRLVPTTGQVFVYPLGLAPFSLPQLPVADLAEFVAAIGYFGNWPFELEIAENGDIIIGEYGFSRIARLPRSELSNPACFSLVPPAGSSGSCTAGPVAPTFPQVIQLPEPGCANPCITQKLVAASWEPSTTTPGLTHAKVAGDMKQLAFDRDDNIWFKHGYYEKGTRDMIRFPPLPALYPTPCAGPPVDLHSSIADGMAVRQSTGEVFGFDWQNCRISRLRRVP